VVAIKRERIINGIAENITAEGHEEYLAMAQDLLDIHEPEAVVASLLSRHYGSQLNEKAYTRIRMVEDRGPRESQGRGAPSRGNDRYGKRDNWDRRRDDYRDESRGDDDVRLFIAKGRSSGMTKRLLVDYIKEHARVTDRELDAVQVMEDFSFVTAPPDAARHILQSFDHMENDGKPIVTKARPDNPNGKHLAGRRRGDRHERSDRSNRNSYGSYDDRAARDFEQTGYPRDDRPQSFDRRDRYSSPSDRPKPNYAKKSSKGRFKSSGPKGRSKKGR
jgi:ATP-dependent RNA helicase DeaD